MKVGLPLLLVALATPLVAQDQPAPLAVGTQAPAFTLGGATKDGVLAKPVSLAELKGQTVVLAFFPRSRTGGCTAQMDAYKAQYETLFHGGKGVRVFAVSVDPDTMQASWARDKDYPVTFLSDPGAETVRQYGAARKFKDLTVAARILYVIDGSGKIVHVMAPFRETDPTAYTELGEAVTKVSGH